MKTSIWRKLQRISKIYRTQVDYIFPYGAPVALIGDEQRCQPQTDASFPDRISIKEVNMRSAKLYCSETIDLLVATLTVGSIQS